MAHNQTPPVGKVLKIACDQCPFRRDVDPTICEQKGSTPEAFIGQVVAPFMLPCHKQGKFDRNARDPELLHCAGAASMRASLRRAGKLGPLPDFLPVGPEDPTTFFGTHAEFLAHHLRIGVEEADYLLRRLPPAFWAMFEMQKAGVQPIDLGEKTCAGT